MSISLKIVLSEVNEIHKVAIKPSATYEHLVELVRETFRLPESQPFSFFYIDSESDYVSVSCSEDLEAALPAMMTSRTFTLYLLMEPTEEQSSSSSSSSSASEPTNPRKEVNDRKRKIVQAYRESKAERPHPHGPCGPCNGHFSGSPFLSFLRPFFEGPGCGASDQKAPQIQWDQIIKRYGPAFMSFLSSLANPQTCPATGNASSSTSKPHKQIPIHSKDEKKGEGEKEGTEAKKEAPESSAPPSETSAPHPPPFMNLLRDFLAGGNGAQGNVNFEQLLSQGGAFLNQLAQNYSNAQGRPAATPSASTTTASSSTADAAEEDEAEDLAKAIAASLQDQSKPQIPEEPKQDEQSQQ